MQKGIFYITESAIALALMAAIIFSLAAFDAPKPAEKAGEVYIIQRLDDILKARFLEGDFSAEKMAADFEMVFPGKSGFVEANGKRIGIGKGGGSAVAAGAVFYSANLKRKELVVSVFID
ncbi:MAG: hypothetical protein NT067_05855 [Candidatus Diapherotrites archaeon]|nr:hypothetical protein [Candidatus Diapherotrites archaeon]